ncbi:MAG: hypothetical protein HY730_00230 [Candidatus Tectomicrobia bacterium]|uniref:Transposase DDE domain-containing protein n=1 Tax=Tectimicrobiota bacterium TaxID=2528274 RepID=A0A933GJ26_UNCTE|nr:hypothetical protein [Candidatus Tectomicrobia bacterium]
MLSGQYVCLQACRGCRYENGCKAKASKKRYEKIYKEEKGLTSPKEATKYPSK